MYIALPQPLQFVEQSAPMQYAELQRVVSASVHILTPLWHSEKLPQNWMNICPPPPPSKKKVATFSPPWGVLRGIEKEQEGHLEFKWNLFVYSYNICCVMQLNCRLCVLVRTYMCRGHILGRRYTCWGHVWRWKTLYYFSAWSFTSPSRADGVQLVRSCSTGCLLVIHPLLVRTHAVYKTASSSVKRKISITTLSCFISLPVTQFLCKHNSIFYPTIRVSVTATIGNTAFRSVWLCL
jgi:hypothetical protein